MTQNWAYTTHQIALLNNMDRVQARAWVASMWLKEMFGHDIVRQYTPPMCRKALRALPVLVDLTAEHGLSIDPGEDKGEK